MHINISVSAASPMVLDDRRALTDKQKAQKALCVSHLEKLRPQIEKFSTGLADKLSAFGAVTGKLVPSVSGYVFNKVVTTGCLTVRFAKKPILVTARIASPVGAAFSESKISVNAYVKGSVSAEKDISRVLSRAGTKATPASIAKAVKDFAESVDMSKVKMKPKVPACTRFDKPVTKKSA